MFTKSEVQVSSPARDISPEKPHLILDLYVLSQAVKTGVYRVCDEIFPRLIENADVPIGYFIREGFEEGAARYIKEKGLPENIPIFTPLSEFVPKNSLLLSPFGVAPEKWLKMKAIKHAHIVYDLIAIRAPGYFTQEGAFEVRSIIASLRSDTTVFAISQYTKNDLLNYRTDLVSDQVTVIPLAASDKFAICSRQEVRQYTRKKYGIPEKIPYLLSLATLEIRKNMEQVIRSYVHFMNHHPDSELHLVLSGMTGWKAEKIDAALSAAGSWRHRIITTGYVEDMDLPALYSDALCFLYLSRAEGFGLPPLEAMACGTPVITSNNTSLPEVVGDAGWMFDPDDTDGIVDCIVQLLGSSELRAEYSKKGLERARNFSWDCCAAIMLKELRKRLSAIEAPSILAGSDQLPVANFDCYQDGASGPRFPLPEKRMDVSGVGGWPKWNYARGLSPASIVGGLRTKGIVKESQPNLPLISYLTVVRNNDKGIGKAIQSVQAQTYTNIEHIIIDGASTDRTLDVIRKFSGQIDYFLSEPDGGLYDAINKAIPLARGDLICILNSDDWLEPEAAAIAAKHMSDRIQQNSILLTAANVYSIAQMPIHSWPPAFLHPGSYLLCPNICHNGIYATRKAYEQAGAYDSSYRIAADSKWILQCLDSGSHVVYTTEPTINYSLGGVSGDADKHGAECIRIIRDRFPFLDMSDAETLYYGFNVFAREKASRLNISWSRCIRHLFAKYSDKPDFLLTLAWAGVLNMEHRYDLEGEHASLFRKLRTSPRLLGFFARYPRLFNIVRFFYRRYFKKSP